MNKETRLILETLKFLLSPKIYGQDYQINLGARIEQVLSQPENKLEKRREKSLEDSQTSEKEK